eukprot:NODE_8019_length_537_cov_6.407787_g6971_i0.p4 GENE.NODE_8019_length_537_cov_6.407787_g6971_i0~~NODE_8019_length_537_cov_6.407787_g6971_i0.p4  ORF type:complete len:61 (-),score=0.69 NODE_8019_length_537_cov_6.407787_g6971_i0:76-258(-)
MPITTIEASLVWLLSPSANAAGKSTHSEGQRDNNWEVTIATTPDSTQPQSRAQDQTRMMG